MKDLISLSKEKKGLTFMETVVAMMIAAIMLVGFLQVCNSSALMLRNIKYRVRAINIAQAEIEDVSSLGYEGINMALFPRTVDIIIDAGPTQAANDDVRGQMTTTVRNATLGPDYGRKIIVDVSWGILGEIRQDILETVVYSHLQTQSLVEEEEEVEGEGG